MLQQIGCLSGRLRTAFIDDGGDDMKKKIIAAVLSLLICLGMAGTVLAEGQGAAAQVPVHAGSVTELKNILNAYKSDVLIMLDGKDYVVGELYLNKLENVTIQGTQGTRLVSTSGSDTVVRVEDCKSLSLRDIIMGHDLLPDEKDCSQGVIQCLRSEMDLAGCDIYGCGLFGISLTDSTVTASATTIRDCAWNIMWVSDSSITCKDCIFSGNGYKAPNDNYFISDPHEKAILTNDSMTGSALIFSGCIFSGNQNPQRVGSLKDIKDRSSVRWTDTFENCTFYGNAWGGDNVTEPPVLGRPAA